MDVFIIQTALPGTYPYPYLFTLVVDGVVNSIDDEVPWCNLLKNYSVNF